MNVLFSNSQLLGGWAQINPGNFRNWEANASFFLKRVYNNRFIAVGNKRVIEYEEAIVIGGPAHVWWHWLIETLPTLHSLETSFPQYRSIPIAIPELVLLDPNKLEMLQRIVGARPLLPLLSGTVHRFSKVILPSPATSPGPTEFALGSSGPAGTFHEATVRNFFNDFAGFSNSEKSPSVGVFLARRDVKDRVKNAAEYLQIAHEAGLRIVFSEELHYSKVAEIVSTSHLVVTFMGSGVANIAFAHRRPNVIIIGSASWRFHVPFANLLSMYANRVLFFEEDQQLPLHELTKSFEKVLRRELKSVAN